MIRIIDEENGVIRYEKVEEDIINRAEVGEIERRVALIKENIGRENIEIEECERKIEFANEVIRLADERLECPVEEDNRSVEV